MSTAPNTRNVPCPQCQREVRVPATAGGRRVKCTYCASVFVVPEAAAIPQGPELQLPADNAPPVRAIPPIRTPSQTEQPMYAVPVQAAPVDTTSATGFPIVTNEESVSDRARRMSEPEDDGAFSAEKKGLQHGVVGGLAMMAIAAVWFFAGLAAGRIFYYPPVLFLIGLYGFFNGLLEGNMAGRRRRRR